VKEESIYLLQFVAYWQSHHNSIFLRKHGALIGELFPGNSWRDVGVHVWSWRVSDPRVQSGTLLTRNMMTACTHERCGDGVSVMACQWPQAPVWHTVDQEHDDSMYTWGGVGLGVTPTAARGVEAGLTCPLSLVLWVPMSPTCNNDAHECIRVIRHYMYTCRFEVYVSACLPLTFWLPNTQRQTCTKLLSTWLYPLAFM